MPNLVEAVRKGDSAVVVALLEAGTDPNMRNEDGITPLHYAVFDGHGAIASNLIKAGADINARIQPDYSSRSRFKNRSVLQYAVEGGHIDCVQVLLDSGVNLFSRDEDGLTAIDLAADEDHDPDIACLLIRARWLERRKDYP